MQKIFGHINYEVYDHNQKQYLIKYHSQQDNVGVYEGTRDIKTKKFIANRLFCTLSATSLDEAVDRSQKIILERS